MTAAVFPPTTDAAADCPTWPVEPSNTAASAALPTPTLGAPTSGGPSRFPSQRIPTVRARAVDAVDDLLLIEEHRYLPHRLARTSMTYFELRITLAARAVVSSCV